MAKVTTGILIAILLSLCVAAAAAGASTPSHLQAAGVLTMQECLNCHSGYQAKAVTICLGTRCLFSKIHSILRPYPPPGKAREYAPRSEIEKAGCVLENGKTTCLSCHDLTKPAPYYLILDGDKLCSLCHLYYATGRPR